MKIPTTKPYFTAKDIDAISVEIRSILKNGQLILGHYTNQLEDLFRNYCGVKHAIAVSSCTAALEIALRYFDVKGKNVIVPTNTFIASSNAIIYSGGTPILADIQADTLCLDPADLKSRITPRTTGVIVVHIAGLPHPAIDEIRDICNEKELFLLEDVAHAHGAMINHQVAGSFGDAGCFSFYPTKVMTTCTGGMLTTNDDNLAEYAISLRHHGVGRDLHDIINMGNDWLMDEISAVLGIHQLKNLETNVRRRNEIADRYENALVEFNGLKVFEKPSYIRHSYYKYPVLLSEKIDTQKLRDIMKNLYDVALGSVYDPPCHLQPVYQRLYHYHVGMFPVAENILKRVFCLPMFPQMTNKQFNYIIQSLREALSKIRAT